jgi:hypothetical protein
MWEKDEVRNWYLSLPKRQKRNLRDLTKFDLSEKVYLERKEGFR